MSNNGCPCWICGAYLEPGNPTDYIPAANACECRRCQSEIAKKLPDPQPVRLSGGAN